LGEFFNNYYLNLSPFFSERERERERGRERKKFLYFGQTLDLSNGYLFVLITKLYGFVMGILYSG